MNYKKLLEESYKKYEETQNSYESVPRLKFLADSVFGFTTSEHIVASLMAKKCLEVCKVITEDKTFEYLLEKEGYWFHVMVNMPFFDRKLSWGYKQQWNLSDSINNIYEKKIVIDDCDLYYDNDHLEKITFHKKGQWVKFIYTMIEFVNKELGTTKEEYVKQKDKANG